MAFYCLFNAVGIVRTYGHNCDNSVSSTTVEATVPLLCSRWGNCLFWCNERERLGRPFTVLPPTLCRGRMLLVLVR